MIIICGMVVLGGIYLMFIADREFDDRLGQIEHNAENIDPDVYEAHVDEAENTHRLGESIGVVIVVLGIGVYVAFRAFAA